MNRITGLIAIALLSGCAAVGPGPSASSVTPPSAFVYAPPLESRAILADLLPRDDPAFQALITAVDTDAPDLQAALARVEAARAALRAAGANRAPNIQGSGSVTASRSSENSVNNLPPGVSFDPSTSSYALGINASWDLDLFGRLKNSQKAASLRLDAADTDAKAVRLTLVADIGRAVVDYRTAEARLAISGEDLADAEALVNLTSTRVRAGIVPGFDLVRAEGLEASARSQLAPAESEKALALGQLVSLTARDGATVLAALQQPASNQLAALPVVGLPATLLRQRPDVVAAEYRLGAANAEIAAAAALRFPQISINAALGLAAIALGDVFSADSLTASFGPSIAGPLFDFGRIEAQIDARQADAKEAFALYHRAVFLAMGECETALGTLRATRQRLAALERQLRIEADSVKIARERYRLGLSDFLTVIDAQRQLNATRQVLAQSRGDADRAEVNVYRSFGGA